MTPAANFASGTSGVVGVNDNGSKFAAGVNDTGGKWWEQYQTADILKWTWRKKFIYMLILYVNYTKVFQKK